MYREIYNDFKNKANRNLTSIDRLNEYINSYERNFGEIRVKNVTIKRHDKILSALQNLKDEIEKDKISKEQAFENLRQSNMIMRETIRKLHEEMKTCTKDIRDFQNFDDLNTDRLLQINPLYYPCPIR